MKTGTSTQHGVCESCGTYAVVIIALEVAEPNLRRRILCEACYQLTEEWG